MAYTIAQLKTEITTDPLVLGYAALRAVANDIAIANLMNAVGVGANYNVYVNNMMISTFVGAIVAADFLALTALQLQQLAFIFLNNQTLDGTNPNIRSIVATIFAGKTTSLTNFAAIGVRQGSRADALWGVGTVVSAADVGATR